MIRKQIYTIESTLNKNKLMNYNRFLSNGFRNEIYSKERCHEFGKLRVA